MQSIGPAYLITAVDADEEVSESDEDNDVSFREINVVAGDGPQNAQQALGQDHDKPGKPKKND